jgi:hypothetical protein
MLVDKIFVIFLLLIVASTMQAQEQDSIALIKPDSVLALDTIPSDSTQVIPKYNISKNAIDQEVSYGSRDSLIMDNKTRLVHLYGNAYVNYGSLDLKADYIMLDLNTNIALAEGLADSLGQMAGTPVFKDGTQEIEAGRMRYNFKSRKGLVYQVTTTESDMYIHGATTKFYGEGGDENREHHTIYSSDAIFTTCDHDVPHFGIRSKKQKIVPNKVAIVGPSNLEIGGVPTPLFLPFGFFPLKIGKRGGLMFPNNYQYSNRWGYGFNNIGYYFPLSDNFDFTLLTDVYFRGSFATKGELRYKKRYKYTGSLNLGYSSYKTEQVDREAKELVSLRDKSFFLRLSHNQDPAAHPNRTIGGSINIQSNQFDNLNYNDARNVLNNSLSSNFSLTQKFPGTPFTATLGLSHSQNTATRIIQMSLPRFDIRMKQINPFKRKKRTGPEKWYEKVTLGYNSSLRYDLNGIDTSFFEAQTFQDGKFGVQHNITTNVNFNVLKYFQLAPFINFKETWYTKETNRFFDGTNPTIVRDTFYDPLDSTQFSITLDTTLYGEVVDDRYANFSAIHQYDAGVSLFTKIYGTARFKKGWLRGIRHTIKPSISLSYSPDYTTDNLGYFDEYIATDRNGERDTVTYSLFDREVFGGAPSGGERFSLNYSLINLFEAKLFNKKDSTFKKSNILDNLNLNGNYNFAADSLKWSLIGFSGNVRLFKGLATVKLSGAFDPYALNENGRRINTFEREVSGKLLRFDNARLSFNTGMTIKQVRGIFSNQNQGASTGNRNASQKEKATLLGIFDNLRLTYQFTLSSKKRSDNSLYFEPSVHSIAIRGEIPLSPKWRFTIGNLDYNFQRKATSYPDLSISRDLHCWTMGVGWQPERSTYNFYIRVKPGSLDFIQVPYRRNRADGFDD